MLTDIKDQSNYTEQNIFLINDEPVMKNALEVLTILGKTGKIIIKGKGKICPNTVSVANIITENLLKGNSKVVKITVDGKISDSGYMIPTIEIMIQKIG